MCSSNLKKNVILRHKISKTVSIKEALFPEAI